MNRLPGELIVHLCSVLPTSDLKAFRLCCKQFADLGEASLFHSLDFRLWPSLDRLSGFEQLVQKPGIASKLRKLSLTTGVQLEYADYRYWQAQVYAELSSNWIRSYSGKTPPTEEYRAFHNQLQARFTERTRTDYDLYRLHLDIEADVFAKQFSPRLREALDHLPQHIPRLTYQITMAEPQITLDAVEGFRTSNALLIRARDKMSPRRVVSMRRQATLDHFSGFLYAIAMSHLPFSDLTLHHLPLQLLEPWQLRAGLALDRVFTKPIHLDLSICYLPHSDWLPRHDMGSARLDRHKRLRYLLNKVAKLESLFLETRPFLEEELSMTLFGQGLQDSTPRHYLKTLSALSLSRFNCTWSELRSLLGDTRQLQHLTLAHARVDTGSMVDLVTFMPSLHLRSVQILGIWTFEDDRGEWHAHTPGDFTGCINATDYEGPYVHNGLKSIVDEYMLNGHGKCPLADQASWDLLGDTSWHFIAD